MSLQMMLHMQPEKSVRVPNVSVRAQLLDVTFLIFRIKEIRQHLFPLLVLHEGIYRTLSYMKIRSHVAHMTSVSNKHLQCCVSHGTQTAHGPKRRL